MGFFADWVNSAEGVLSGLNRMYSNPLTRLSLPTELHAAALTEAKAMSSILGRMRQSRIIKISADQLKLFYDLPLIKTQDYLKLRSPYNHVYIEPVGNILTNEYFDNVNAPIKGLLISSTNCDDRRTVKLAFELMVNHKDGAPEELRKYIDNLDSVVQTVAFVPLAKYPENTYAASLVVSKTGELVFPQTDISRDGDVQGGVDRRFSEKLITLTIHLMNFLTSPTVVLEQHEHPEALQRSRAKKGKEPLPGWYEIKYKQHRTETKPRPEGEYEKASEHSFRYDVRGHFMHFKKGRMAGRVIWCPAHQRGLKHTLYKPKSYRTEQNDLPAQPTIYQG